MWVDYLTSDSKRFMDILAPSWEQVEGAIRALDGRSLTEVVFGRRDTQAMMAVAGGPTRYLVNATLDHDVFFELGDPDGDPKQSIWLVAGGQGATVRLTEAVPLDRALRAARVFAERGGIAADEVWARNPPG